MNSSETAPAMPKLLKSRMRHTRIFIAALVPYLLFTDSAHPDGGWLHEPLEWLGHLLVVIGVLGRVYCTAYIGGKKNDELITCGPYSVVRNPLYVFSFIAIVGVGLQSATLSLTVFLIAVFAAYYPAVIAREEAFLLHRFGAAYEDYRRRVRAWIPRLELWNAPEEMLTRPIYMWRTMRDASLFFLPFPLFELISELHANGILPVLAYMP